MARGGYELDSLGWLHFQELCELLLDLEAETEPRSWRGSAENGRGALLSGRLRAPALDLDLPGPVAIAVAWVRPGSPALPGLALRNAVAHAVRTLPHAQLLVLTNLERGAAREALACGPIAGDAFEAADAILGASEISRCLERNATLRARLPSVLGLRDLPDLVAEVRRTRSTLDLATAHALARVFVPTVAYATARATLARHRFAVLTGPPEMGKTAIARMLALAALCEGVEAYDCTTPEQVHAAFDRQRRQLFIADDAFGSTEYRPDAAERWARELGAILSRLDARHQLIWTSRPAPLKAGLARVRRERGAERFPAPGEVLVDASALSMKERALILYRHAKQCELSELGRAALRRWGATIVEHPHFTPERIRRFAAGRIGRLHALAGTPGESQRIAALVEEELSSPTDAMLASFHALAAEHRELLVALLDAPAGLIGERELAATVRRHYDGGLPRPPAELVDRLADHFLSVTPLGIGWVHPSWRDLVIDELRGDATQRRRFLSRSGVDGALLALSQGGGASGERALPLLVGDGDWDELAARLATLVRELDGRQLARLLTALASLLASRSLASRHHEAHHLAVFVLGCCRRDWEARGRALPTALLAAWLELRAVAEQPTPAPCLLRTWIEAHPGDALRERPLRRDALTRIEDWLSLVRLLAEHEPRALASFEFSARDKQPLIELIGELIDVEDPELQPLARSVLARIAEAMPAASPLGALVRHAARAPRPLEHDGWWTPSDLDAPPSDELASVPPPAFTREDVERVLRDL
ncbi:MAG: nSTAND3 domain-containing NTPase [Solirubrobacteraceae bacterium]